MIEILIAGAMIPGTALAWRLRGHKIGEGWIGSNAVNRTIWAAWATLAVYFIVGPTWWLLATFAGGWYAATLGHRAYIGGGIDRADPLDLEDYEAHVPIGIVLWAADQKDHEANRDASGLLWTGALRGFLIGVWYSPWLMLGLMTAGAIGHFLGYWIGNRVDYVPGRDWIERSELAAGALMGGGFAFLILV